MPARVGFVGLGNMGAPMARNLLDADFSVVGHNRSRGPVEELVAAGGEAADSPRDVAERADLVVTCLPDTDAVDAVVRGPDGLVEGFAGDETLIDTSTIAPARTEELAAAVADVGARMLDAPVSGGQSGAREGSLSIMVGGDRDAFEDASDVFDALGASVAHCGGPGAGQVTKACNQMVVSVTMEAVAEALVFAEKGGADLEAVLDAISGGAASCWVLDERAPQMIRGDFEPGFYAAYQYKDLRIATDAGEDYGAPMPATETTAELFKSAVEMGHGREANTAILKVVEKLANAEARIEE